MTQIVLTNNHMDKFKQHEMEREWEKATIANENAWAGFKGAVKKQLDLHEEAVQNFSSNLTKLIDKYGDKA